MLVRWGLGFDQVSAAVSLAWLYLVKAAQVRRSDAMVLCAKGRPQRPQNLFLRPKVTR